MADGMHNAGDVFAPLPDMEAGQSAAPRASRPTPAPAILPAPIPLPTVIRHREHGTPAQVWPYRDETGALLFVVARFDTPHGKEVLPYVATATRWRWGAPPVPRSLYGLDWLAERSDAPVLLVEGEKAAEAARELFPGHVVMTWQGGSEAVSRADWTPLAGRSVILWPDADAAGAKAARSAVEALCKAGAARVAVVELPLDLPEGWDVADPLPAGVTLDNLRTMLAEAAPVTADEAEEAGATKPDGTAGAKPDPLAALRDDVARAAGLGADEWALARKAMAARHGVPVSYLDGLREEHRHAQAAADRKRRAETAEPSPDTDERGRARLFVDAADLPDTARELGQHLGRAAHLFVRGRPVRLVRDETTGELTADLLTPEGVVAEAHRVTRPWQHAKGKGGVMQEVPVTLPDRVARLYLADPGAWGLLPLAGIAAAPLLHDDGAVHAVEGYDPRSRMWCRAVPSLELPDEPTREDAAAALLTLRQHLRTFAFADAPRTRGPCEAVEVVDLSQPPGNDESAALAALLTAVCRPSLDLAPALVVRAPPYSGSGTGKGLLVRVLCAVAFGAAPSAMTAGADPAELDKRLTAALIGAAPVLFLDNLNATALKSDVLASAITESPAEVRRLGQSVVVRLNPSAFVAITGNGLKLSEDLARRFLIAELDARTEDPETRAFKGDIVADTLADRARLLSAALTLWRWGRREGDALPRGRPMGSFGRWSRWCRDPLVALGCADPATRIAEAKAADPRRQMVGELFAAWWTAHGPAEVTVAGLADAVKLLADPSAKGRQYLARYISNLAGTRAGGYALMVHRPEGRHSPDRYSLHVTAEGRRPNEGPAGAATAQDAPAGAWEAEL
ncbi:hypothetical protein EAH89_21365 [Roseomonas nepalensis]|uniref:Uncharacterized protein n=1 Tax=Muricoccus nepalensis TaxID=1854500 RepID=A0A502FJ95_9PROT|nr:DUF6371 domain-containing protein [Roseomonas nepalensis]TPG49560.1 hypothetical protein EAH89_21365 [Roseomonas nepalensis]